MNDRSPNGGRPATFRGRAGARLFVVLLSALLPLGSGCESDAPRPTIARPQGPESVRMNRKLFDEAIARISQYERYDSPEWLQHAVGRLDQWVQDQPPVPDWELTPLVEGLSEPFREMPEVQSLDRLEFPGSDVYAFQEAAWLHDVAEWARGDAVDELDQAKQLFDWTMRNVQSQPITARDASGRAFRLLQRPWETLLLGSGSSTDRAWLFVLLARQQGIDAALLALTDPSDPDSKNAALWAVGVLIEGDIYVFEPALGLPIPGPDGLQRAESGALDVQPATLAEVAADDALLRQLDVTGYRYPVDSAAVQRVVALVEGSPAYLSHRMKAVESQLASSEAMVLTTDATAQAERFEACEHVVAARLWEVPYETLQQERQLGAERAKVLAPRLIPFRIPFDVSTVAQRKPQEVSDGDAWWTEAGRVRAQRDAEEAERFDKPQERTFAKALLRGRLLHFKGKFSGEESAGYYYTRARIPNSVLESPEMEERVKLACTLAKMDASYWLGMIAAERGNTDAAIDWLAVRTLEAFPDGRWTPGAKHNLGRVYESAGQIDKAVATYRSTADSPPQHADLLRAKWLRPEPVESDQKPAPKQPKKPAERPAKKASEKPARKPAEEPVEKAFEKPAEKAAEKPTEEAADKPAEKPVEKPTENPAEEKAEEPEQEPASETPVPPKEEAPPMPPEPMQSP